jgi:hypothetical protein
VNNTPKKMTTPMVMPAINPGLTGEIPTAGIGCEERDVEEGVETGTDFISDLVDWSATFVVEMLLPSCGGERKV